MDLLQAAAALLIGLLAGFLGGTFGIGGAIITIPAMRIFLGLSGHVASATALPLTIPAALSGALVFHKHSLIKYKTAITCGLVGAFFAVGGALLTQYFSGQAIMVATGLLLISLSLFMLSEKREEESAELLSPQEKAIYSIAIGACAGFVSGFLGIGGGVILVPLLEKIRKIPLKKAIPTSLAIISIYAIPGAITHFALGNIDVALLGAILAGVLVGAQLGAKRVIKTEEAKLRKWFALLLLIMGVALLLNELITSGLLHL